jgi:hypothetical protein
MAQAVGVIGVDVSGQPIAERIPSAGYPRAVHDIRPWISAASSACRRSSAPRLH